MDEFSALQARIDSQAAPRIERQPASLAPGCHMHPYQLAGLDWLVQRFHAHTSCILGDEMGLGKTLSAIAFVAHLAEHNLAGGSPLPAHKTTKGPFLVVCPLSVVPNWQAEFARFLPTMRTLVYSGSAEHREQLQADISSSVMAQPSAQRRNPNLPFDVLITSYELVLRDAAFLATIPFGVGIVDEAHRLKNNRSALAESMRAEFATVPHWVLLTGTPFQNTVLELFALLQFVAPALFADANEFRTRFGVLTSLTDAAVAPALVAELQARVRPFLLRRLKGDVDIVLPPKREVVLLAGLSSMQKKYYRLILSKNLVALGAQNARCMTNGTTLARLEWSVDSCTT